MTPEIWSVAVDAPLNEALTYEASPELSEKLMRGQRVQVPLGKRKTTGVILGRTSQMPNFSLKQIAAHEVEFPALPEPYLQWLEWLSQYYLYPIGSVVATAYPPLAKKPGSKSRKSPLAQFEKESFAPELTREQQSVLKNIAPQTNFGVHLLHGVTGSGKTEVYLQLLKKTLERGKRCLILVPEISLTPQLIQRFVARFGEQVAVLHSQLTDRERTNQWWEVVDQKKPILIGVRSALFCPIQDLGLIVVDEEHEPSFKQDEKLKYNARDSAIVLAQKWDCPIVLGSATPSLESWSRAKDGKYSLHSMSYRVQDRPLPTVEIVDMRKVKESGHHGWLSPQLKTEIEETLTAGKQVALFLNRRGVAPLLVCQSCGYVHECPNCDISLTLHGRSHLVCHYCDYHEAYKLQCPDCKEGEISAIGLGTERIENEMREWFPQYRVARADRDEIQNRDELESLISKMENHEIDILVGTQMIAKGLDFPHLQLVGLILADVGFNLPDFRATERSFQLITQVSGRAGRHIGPNDLPGKVIIQTYNTSHPSLTHAASANFSDFAEEELCHRQALGYPPYGKLINFRIQGLSRDRVLETCELLKSRSKQLLAQFQSYAGVQVLGPAAAPLAKLRNQFRFHLIIKGQDHKVLNSFARQVLGNENWIPSAVRISVDVDPLHLL